MNVKIFLITTALFTAPLLLKAQYEEYRYNASILTGTSDSRMFFTVNEGYDRVEIQISIIGYMTASAFTASIVYDTLNLILTDPNYIEDIPSFTHRTSMELPLLSVPTSFSQKYPYFFATSYIHIPVMGGDALGMKIFTTDIGALMDPHPNPAVGEMIHVYSMHFKKITPGKPLLHTDFGFFAQGMPQTPMRPLYSTMWIYMAMSVRNWHSQSVDWNITRPNLFPFRSPSHIKTDSVSNIAPESADLHASFSRGNMNPVNNIIKTGYFDAVYDSRLNWDSIVSYGFIYSDQDATILIDGFTTKLNIDGTDYAFPDATEIAAKKFERNGKTFFIKQNNNSSPNQSVAYTQKLTGLEFNTTYYAWSFIHYIFETSYPHLNVGDKIMFTTRPNPNVVCPLNVDFEGGPYDVVSLGGLCWTSNMANRNYADGTPIVFARAYNCKICPDSTENAAIFGLLYTWYSAVGVHEGSTELPMPNADGFVQGICPEGWHVPLSDELNRLSQFPVEDLKSTDYWIISGGTNATGFNARPAGKYSADRNRFEELYAFTGYWSSNIISDILAHYFSITYYCNLTEMNEIRKSDGLSVRCVMDY